jgi:uncharacterized membrane protein
MESSHTHHKREQKANKTDSIAIFDQILHSTLTIMAIILFIVCITLVVLGLKSLVEGWIGISADNAFTTLITGLGYIVIGIAVLDLTKSILDEELAEKKLKNTQERARDFLTRFLPVIIFAISAEVFVTLAQSNIVGETKVFADIAMIGIAVGAMLAGLAYYLKMTAPECRAAIPKAE